MDQTVATWDDHKPMLRTLFSSMFARRMPYVIVGATEGSILYTNIKPERVVLYHPESDDYFHVVSVKGKSMADDFIAPLAGVGTPCMINASTFTRAMNKLKAKVTLLRRDDGTLIIPKVPMEQKDQTPKDEGEAPTTPTIAEVDMDVGRCLTQSEANGYRELFTGILRQLEDGEFQEKNLLASSLDSLQDILIYPFHHRHHDTLLDKLFELDYGIPLRSGESTISIKEYKAEGEPSLKIHLGFEGLSLKHLVEYNDASIKVVSVQPGQRWFAMSK